jgi:Kef-type K+ transport system membrane component KefB
VGGVLLIPFFLLSTGMLIDPEKFTQRRVLLIAALSLAIVFVGKGCAALLSGRVLGLERPQVKLLFGLSLAQAAATLAAVTVGVKIGLFDEDLRNATLVVVLVTVLVSSIVTRSAARAIEPPPVQGERLAESVFVPVDVVDDPAVVRLAARLAMAKGGIVLVGAVAVASGGATSTNVVGPSATSRLRLRSLSLPPPVRVDTRSSWLPTVRRLTRSRVSSTTKRRS